MWERGGDGVVQGEGMEKKTETSACVHMFVWVHVCVRVWHYLMSLLYLFREV